MSDKRFVFFYIACCKRCWVPGNPISYIRIKPPPSTHHNFGSFGLGFRFGVRHADQITVGDKSHRMAGSANLLVHLVATSDRSVVQGVEHTLVAPWQLRRVHLSSGSGHRLFEGVQQGTGTSYGNTSGRG